MFLFLGGWSLTAEQEMSPSVGIFMCVFVNGRRGEMRKEQDGKRFSICA